MRWSVLILCLLCINCFSQQASIDSLKKVLLNTKGDTSRANILYDISDSYRGLIMIRRFTMPCCRCNYLRVSFPKEMRAYAAAGVALRYSGNYTTAIEFFLRAFNWLKNTGCRKRSFSVTWDSALPPKTWAIISRRLNMAKSLWNMKRTAGPERC